ncbi:hypothetical protein OQA88_1940 [Cercophora sp. LCS_1]
MDSFKQLKRRTTDLFNNIPQSIQSLNLGQHGGHHHGKRSGPSMKGTWEKISGLPSLPRSSHTINIVAGNVYIFGGESADARKPADNDMHVVTLPSSGAPADYYTIKAKAAPLAAPEPESESGAAPAPAPAPKPVAKASTGKEATSKPATASKPATTGEDTGSEEEESDSDEEEEESSEEEEDDDEDEEEEESDSESESDKGKTTTLPSLPTPRVGHATATIDHRIYLFGGRGGPSMTPLDEAGRVWVFDTHTHLWSFLDPVPSTAVPPPRSYHVAIATSKPSSFNKPGPPARATTWRDWALGTTDIEETGTPQRPVVGNIATHATDTTHGTFIVHGGCLSDGTRASDIWAFDVHSQTWQRLPDAPAPARGGTAIALSRNKLYRFGGFDGKSELGGQLDVLDLTVDSFNDAVSAGEVSVTARRGWSSILQDKEDVGYKESDPAEAPLTEDETSPWPGPRSVARLEAVSVGGGREYLVLILGERNPSGGGHEVAGKFWDDIWAFQVPAESGSVAGLADTVRRVAGGKSGEGTWTRVEMGPWDDEDDASADGPGARGWIASAPMGELEENGIVVWGGVDEGNKRLGDGWILRLA